MMTVPLYGLWLVPPVLVSRNLNGQLTIHYEIPEVSLYFLAGQRVNRSNPLAKIDSVSTYNQRNKVSFHREALVQRMGRGVILSEEQFDACVKFCDDLSFDREDDKETSVLKTLALALPGTVLKQRQKCVFRTKDYIKTVSFGFRCCKT